MNGLVLQIIFLIISYLLGSIPWALIVGKLVKGIDIREHGSKNMGATNAFRVLGFKYGLLVFALDALKGGIILFIMKHNFFNFDLGDFIIHPLSYGACAFLGHLFPIFAKFKGGKGFASFLGMALAVNWKCALVLMIVVVLVTLITDYIVVGTMTTIISFPAYMGWETRNYIIPLIILIASIVIIYKHRENLVRIYKGTEIGFRSANRGDHR